MNNGTHLTGDLHLSDDQIDDYLIGDLAAGPSQHLADCDPCQLRVREMEAPIASFKAVSLAWSERQSATLPLKPEGFPRVAWHRRAVVAGTAAAALLLGIAVPLVKHHNAGSDTIATGAAITGPITVADASPLREEQIARDNQMLQAIDHELSPSVASPSETFGLEAVSGTGPGHTRAAQQLRN